MKLNVEFNPQAISIDVNSQRKGIAFNAPVVKEFIEMPTYAGEYSVVPSSEAQILETSKKQLTDNIVIEPIPQNYGLITWNGAFLTVS